MNRTTYRNAGFGFLVGFALTYIPVISVAAPLVGGGVAGYLERRGSAGGLRVGALAGALIAVAGFLLTTGLVAFRFGIEGLLPVQGVPLSTLSAGFLIGTALTLVSMVGTVVVAAIGGGLGGILEEDRNIRQSDTSVSGDRPRARRVGIAVASIGGGVVTFVAVGLGVTAALDPYIWPSALVGLPTGAIAGFAVAVLVYHVLTTRRAKPDRQERGPRPQ